MTAGSAAATTAAAARPAARPRACTTSCGPSRPAGRTTVARFAALVEGAGYGLALTPIARARGRLPPRHRGGERGRRQGDVRLRGPRRPDHGPAPRGHGADGARLRAAPPGPALEGLVRGAARSATRTPSKAATASTSSWAWRRSGRPTPTSTSRWSRWPTTSSRASACARSRSSCTPWATGSAGRATSSCSASSWPSAVEQLCPAHRARHLENPLRVLDCKTPECRAATEDAPRFLDHLCDACAAHFARVRAGLDALGVAYTIDHRLVRGFDYYTRTTFEFAPGASTPRRTASAAAAATTAWSRCSAAPRRRASASASGSSGCSSPATPRVCSRPRPRCGAAAARLRDRHRRAAPRRWC